jgi:hypothetical protein
MPIGNDTNTMAFNRNPDLPKLLRAMAGGLDAIRQRHDIILNAAAAEIERLRAYRALPIASGMADRVVAFISERDPFGDSFSAHDLEQIEHRLGSAARLSAVVQDMLGGLAYLRSTDTVPYGFGIDRLEQTGRAALAGTDQPTLTEPPEGGP